MSSSVATELVAGSVAGAAGILATQPLDTIRIRLQSSATSLGRGAAYGGVAECARLTLREEGVRGLYKGVASPTLTVGGMNAVLFFSYEYASAALTRASGNSSVEELPLAGVYAAGSLAGLTTSFITGPTELVKCIAQTDLQSTGRFREEWAIFRNMVRQHGVFGAHGPTRGLLTTIVREVPSMGLYFTIYEASCRKYGKSPMVSFFAGGFAGAAAWSCIYPIDVIKTRWQTAAPGKYNSVLHCLWSSVAQEGRGMLLSGYGATMCRAWPQNAVIFVTYEFVKGFMEGQR